MTKDVLKRIFPMIGTRALNMAMPMVDVAIVTNIVFVAAGSLLLATQVVQIFVVIASSAFVGINLVLPRLLKSNSFIVPFRETLGLSVSLGLVSMLSAIGLSLIYSNDSQAIGASVILAVSLVPLFIYSAILATLESSGFERELVSVGWKSNIVNLISSLLFLYIFESPVIAVCLGTLLVRIFMMYKAYTAAYKYGLVKSKESYNWNYIKRLIQTGTPEVLSSILFVSLMTVVVGISANKLSELELAVLSTILNYMNFLFVIGIAIPISLAVTFSINSIISFSSFIKTSITVTSMYFAVSLLTVPAAVMLFGQAKGLNTGLLLASIAIYIDISNMTLITYLRLCGHEKYPAFTRIVLFMVLGLYLALESSVTLFNLLIAFIFGNAFSLSLLIIWCVAIQSCFIKRKHKSTNSLCSVIPPKNQRGGPPSLNN